MSTNLFSGKKFLRRLYLPGLLALAGLLFALAWAEQITLSTYYPAPYGVYKEMDVHYLDFKPDIYQEADPHHMPAHQEARICYDRDTQQFKYSDGTNWLPLGSGGGVINVEQAIGTSNISLSWSLTFVDMPDMQVNITTRGGHLLILFSATLTSPSPPWMTNPVGVRIRILIDGGERVRLVDETGITSAGERIHLSTYWLERGLPAGSHTIQVQWAVSESFGPIRQEGSPFSRILSVIELGRS